MSDQFANQSSTLLTPGRDGANVSPSDSVDLTTPAKSLFVGTGGNVSLITPKGTTLIFKNVPNGGYVRMGATRVTSTNTTASDIIAITE